MAKKYKKAPSSGGKGTNGNQNAQPKMLGKKGAK